MTNRPQNLVTADYPEGMQNFNPAGNYFVETNQKKYIVIDGDSLGAQGYYRDTTQALYKHIGWWVWALAYLKQSLGNVSITAMGGLNAQQILARFDTYVKPLNPTEVWAIIGQNNLQDTDNGAAACVAIEAYAQKVRALGATLRLGTVTPRAGANQTATVKATQTAINTQLRKMAAAGTIKLFDSCAAVTDINSADGAAITGYFYDNSIHFGPIAARKVAEQFIRDFPKDFDYNPLIRVSSNLDSRQVIPQSKNLILNPKLRGVGGTKAGTGISGDVPDSWTVIFTPSGAGTTAVVGAGNIADPVDTGRSWYKMTFSGAVAASQIDTIQVNQSQYFSTMAVGGTVTPGVDIIESGKVYIKAAGFSGQIQDIEFTVEVLNGSSPLFTTYSMFNQGYVLGNWPDDEIVLTIPPMPIPVGATRTRVSLFIKIAAGAVSGDLFISDIDITIA